MAKRKTAGALSLKAKADNTVYDPLELGHAITDDVVQQLRICAERHEKIFDEDEYCVVLFVCSDPMLANVRRHKYAAFLYLPSPRPQQSVFFYNKINKNLTRLWSMPDARVMATICDMPYVVPMWQNTQGWCRAFFHGWRHDKVNDVYINTTPHHFFEFIRKQHNIKMLSEKEYLDANREELIKAGCKEVNTLPPEPFDFSKIATYKVIDKDDAIVS